jgi:hypothetical protein
METKEIIKEIQKLPVAKRMLIVERTLKGIRESDTQNLMATAAESLAKYYKTDKELVAFTQLDQESFYEAR